MEEKKVKGRKAGKEVRSRKKLGLKKNRDGGRKAGKAVRKEREKRKLEVERKR